ncbi:MAG: hypothetical protein ACRC4O_09345 [Giesbergeria sp.]
MNLPNLEGQPPWVVVIVMALFTFGVLGLAYLRRGRQDPDSEALNQVDSDNVLANAGNPPALAGAHAPTEVVGRALDYLAEAAKREAAEAEEERRQRREAEAQLRQALDECENEVALLRRNGGVS